MSKYLDADIINIEGMELYNFMGLDGKIFVDFTDSHEFIGDNGVGKSTILDAIAFVFCYTDAFGNPGSKVNFSHAGKLETETYVSLKVRIDNVNHFYKRNFSVTSTGKQVSNLYVDHNEVKITELKKMYDKDVFLSLINPKYISTLSSSQLKDLLVKFVECKDITLATISGSLGLEAIEFLNEELIEKQDIETVKLHYESIQKQNKDLIKEAKNKIKELKLTPKVEQPENEYRINGFIYTEEAAFETLLDNYYNDASTDNKNWFKIFMEQKAQRAAALERFKQFNESVSKIEELEKEIEELEAANKGIEKNLSYIGEFYEAVLSELGITNVVPDLKISFKDKLDKDDFIVTYKDVPIKDCSFAEQVKAGILLSDFLMFYLDINYPIFIDNAECITSMPELIDSHQLVSFTVEQGIGLSRYVGDVVENLETLETMPRSHIKGRVKTRILGGDFSAGE